MSSRDGQEVRAAAVPPWLDQATLRAMEQARERAFAWGRDALGAREAVQDILLAFRPALPLTMVTEAVAMVVPDAEGLTHAPWRGLEGGEVLAAATQQEVAEALSYALRFGLDGRPRRTGHEHLAPLAAAQLVEHLARSRFVIMKRPGLAPHGGQHRTGR